MKSRLAGAAAAGFLMLEVATLTAGPALAGPTTSTGGAVGAVESGAAHEGVGVLVVEARQPVSTLEVAYVVRLSWSGDGHPANGAAVTAQVVGVEGVLPPATLLPQDDDGRYAGTLAFPGPGVWTVRFTSIGPDGVFDSFEAAPPALEAPAAPMFPELPVAPLI